MSAKRSPPRKKAELYTFLPHNCGTVIDSEKSTRIECWPWAFKRAINKDHASPVTSPKWGSGYPYLSCFCRNVDQKPLKVCYKVLLSKNFQQQICSAGKTYRTVSIHFPGDWPRSRKIWRKGTDCTRKDARFTFHTRRAVQSAIADLLDDIAVDACMWLCSTV